MRSRCEQLLQIRRKPIMKRLTLRGLAFSAGLGLAVYQLKFERVPVTTQIVAKGELPAEVMST